MPGPQRPRKSLIADLQPLRESPPFRRLWIGSTVSSLGSAMTGFAVVLQTYDLTHSSFAVGAIGLAQAVPAVVIGLFGGSFADAVDRRRLVLVTSSGLAVVSALFAAQAYAGLRQLWLLFVLAVAAAMLQSVDGPARRTFLPRLLLAGVATATAGLRVCYLVDALSFGAALYGVARLPTMAPQDGGARPGLRAVAEGLRFICRQRVLA